ERAKRLRVSHAFHSPLMDPMLDEFRKVVEGLAFHEPRITMHGDVTDPEYWVRHVREPVRFLDTVRAFEADGVTTFLELGPNAVLTPMITECVEGAVAVSSLRGDKPEPQTVLSALAGVFVRGVAVDWLPFLTGGRRVDLPTYAFQRQRFWLEGATPIGDLTAAGLADADHPLLGAAVELADGDGLVLTGRLSVRAQPWLADCSVLGSTVLPEAALVELALAAADRAGCGRVDELFSAVPLVLPADGSVEIQLTVGSANEAGNRPLALHGRLNGEEAWTLHASGLLAPGSVSVQETLTQWPPADALELDVDGVYERLAALGYDYGPAFHGLRRMWRHESEIFAEVELPEALRAGREAFTLHPALLDAALHPLLPGVVTDAGPMVLPYVWSGVAVHASAASALRVRLSLIKPNAVSMFLVDGTGSPVATVESVELRPASDDLVRAGRSEALFELDLVPVAVAGHAPAVVPVALPGGLVESVRQAQELVRTRLSDDEPLVVVARNDLETAAGFGFLRSARTESTGRIVLVDSDDDPRSRQVLAAAVASGEPELVIREGEVHAPRLVRARAVDAERVSWCSRGTVLITGGTGGLGALLARHLVEERDIRSLLLVSRRGQAAPGAEELRADLTGRGARVTIAACDVTDREALAALIASVPEDHPLTAVVHTAGVVADGVATDLTAEQIDAVLAPKALGARHLHELTKDLPLKAFVLFSSLAGVLGTAGQAGYAAANSYLDALARHRRATGLPAVSMAWGLWGSSGGITNGLTDRDFRRLARAGIRPLSDAEGMELFDTALGRDSAVVVPAGLDVRVLREQADLVPAVLRGLVGGVVRRQASGATPAGLSERDLVELVRTEVAAVLGHSGADAVDPSLAFNELGFDSLTAVELRNRLRTATGLSLPAGLIFDHPTPLLLAAYLRESSGGQAAAVVPAGVSASASNEPIAIVGMACRFPGGVRSPEDLWRLLETGTDALTGFPTDRGWDVEGLYDPDPDAQGHSYVREGGFVDGIASFDPAFFGISPREALAMDPQQRVLLEVAWEAFERAGIDPISVRGSQIGVFAGGNGQDYATVSAQSASGIEGYLVTGNAASVVSGRVSYQFGLTGPAVSVDTACSSSLVALHLAIQALRTGECTMALAGGVTLMSTPRAFVEFSRQRGLAVDGRCKSFAAAADGTGWGVLGNGHPVLAVVRGSAVNQDGASNGLTAPNGPSQQRVIRAALASAGLSTSDVDAVEAHGTGTRLGDPIEAEALLATYGQDRSSPLWLGSLKSNIGHTQAAAGVAGVIKMVEALRHGVLPRTLHVDEPSPYVDWSAGAVELLTETREWPSVDRPRRAAVSSFGVSGTNSHVILEQAPAVTVLPERPELSDPGDTLGVGASVPPVGVPWIFSARTSASLCAQIDQVRADGRVAGSDPVDVGFSLVSSRSLFDHRAVLLDGVEVATGEAASERKAVFVFPGQGSQWIGMAKGLIDSSAVFARSMAACDEALEPFTGWSLLDVVDGELDRVDVVQPVLWAVNVSLAALWRSLGVEPAAVVGHSQGEIAAAYVAGALSLEDAARVVALRSRAIVALSGLGGMLSVPLAAVDVELREGLSIAAVNGPLSTVVSGDIEALQALRDDLVAGGVKARMIPVDYASHSAHVEAIEAELAEVLEPIRPRSAEVPFFSSVTADWLDTVELDAAYWYRNLRQTVRFEDAVRGLVSSGHNVFIECSAHPVLAVGVEETVEATAADGLVLGSLRRDHGGMDTFLTSVAKAFVHGVDVDWKVLFKGAQRVDLPTYPFQRERYWIAPAAAFLDTTVELADDGVVMTGRVSLRTHPWLADHAVMGAVLLPGTAFVELAVQAADRVGCGRVEDLTLEAPLVLPERGAVALQVVVDAERRLTIHSRPDGDEVWTRHATGSLGVEPVQAEDLTVWPPDGAVEVDVDGVYERLVGQGYGYGPAFRGLRRVWHREDEVFAEVALADEARPEFTVHPALLDGATHALLPGVVDHDREPGLPFSWSGVSVHATGATSLRVRISRTGPEQASLTVADGTGAPVATVDSLVSRAMSLDDLRGVGSATRDTVFRVDWVPAPAGGAAAEPHVVEVLTAGGQDVVADVRAVLRRTLEVVQGDAEKVVLVTRNAVSTDGESDVDVRLAAALGLVRSAQTENPGRFVLLDVDTDDFAHLVPAALATGEPQLAARDGELFVPRLARMRAPGGGAPWTSRGKVLVTGGTGVLGSLVARHLVVEHGVRRLVLTSRRGPAAPGAQRLLAELLELGADVDVVACDVTDRAALAELLDGVTAVVHTAGVLDDGVVASMTAEQLSGVLGPKVDAGWHLHELTKDRELDAFVLYSSFAGVLGSAGQGNYAAANAFLDALAQHRRAAGLPAVSVAWGLWADSSEMTGHLNQVDLARMRRSGVLPLSAGDGMALFDAAPGADAALVVGARIDVAALRDSTVPELLKGLVRAPSQRGVAGAGEQSGPTLAQRVAGLSASERERVLIDVVRGEASAVLGHATTASVGNDKQFRDIGFDSLTAVELRNRLNGMTGLRLPTTLVFDHPTPKAVARFLAAELPSHSAADGLLSQLDRLEAGLRAADDADHEAIAERLEKLVLRLREPARVAGAEADIKSASVDQLLDLIDTEFDLS
ncbi:SDR family NAD(P)-dependent oxidoreductase, partial [Lentzea aerocolonigenes]|uniref:SDR family NAD(P)-dependent oxidoreductase n=2 Tax=Lentzea aerocolonigenes TaxID=68170 RepID=UPI003557BA20|nr:Acyl transferase domain-containing protein [Lentzea aerocolonigenes]